MLRQNNLDDMRFAEISQRAQTSIDEYFPQWTDLNTHDPGIMLIELFAWLTEQQRFFMNQNEDAQPFFPLLGISLKKAAAAETYIEIPGGFKPRALPKNTPLFAENVRFEITEDIQYIGEPTTVRVVQRETVQTPVVIGQARGYSDESFTVDTKGQIIHEFSLAVAGELWTQTDDFRASRPEDRHYTLCAETGEITFGDGIHGALANGEITVTAMSLTRGPDGNIAPHIITELLDLSVSQPLAATSGAVRETVETALKRNAEDMRQAVTARDIEALVLETPGLEVSRAHAFNAHDEIKPGKPRISVIAIKLKHAVLTDSAKEKIRAQLEPYRLVCRDFIIADVKSIPVSVGIELKAGPHGTGFRESLEASVRAYFEENCNGFGAALRVSELRAFISSVPEVLEVTHCVFRAFGSARSSIDGDITLGRDSVAEIAEVTVRIIAE